MWLYMMWRDTTMEKSHTEDGSGTEKPVQGGETTTRENLKVEMNLNDPFVGTSPNSWRICLHLGEEAKRTGSRQMSKMGSKVLERRSSKRITSVFTFLLPNNETIRIRNSSGVESPPLDFPRLIENFKACGEDDLEESRVRNKYHAPYIRVFGIELQMNNTLTEDRRKSSQRKRELGMDNSEWERRNKTRKNYHAPYALTEWKIVSFRNLYNELPRA
ncbi:hypothetical protein ARMGADRAFT_1068007 [Armillaria gallica]|uniref:Uncharacterized protein n=1 Tax=Armillaria gallica TaxID=47427 RepID=A0A2H3CUD7_ARMGA|nr:hypothetical protein ARMGADRAFT_1068007 [Armillaria gallica]